MCIGFGVEESAYKVHFGNFLKKKRNHKCYLKSKALRAIIFLANYMKKNRCINLKTIEL